MADDPRLGMFLDAWEQDIQDGVTVRALHRRLDDHEQDDAKNFKDHETKIQSLELRHAKEDGKAEGIETVTGSHRVITMEETGTIVRPRTSSMAPLMNAVKKVTGSKVAVLIVSGLSAGLGWLLHHLTWN